MDAQARRALRLLDRLGEAHQQTHLTGICDALDVVIVDRQAQDLSTHRAGQPGQEPRAVRRSGRHGRAGLRTLRVSAGGRGRAQPAGARPVEADVVFDRKDRMIHARHPPAGDQQGRQILRPRGARDRGADHRRHGGGVQQQDQRSAQREGAPGRRGAGAPVTPRQAGARTRATIFGRRNRRHAGPAATGPGRRGWTASRRTPRRPGSRP